MLFQVALYRHVRTASGRWRFRFEFVCATRMTQVRIAFSISKEAIASLRITRATTRAPIETIPARLITTAKFLTIIETHHAFAFFIARLARMIARVIIVALDLLIVARLLSALVVQRV